MTKKSENSFEPKMNNKIINKEKRRKAITYIILIFIVCLLYFSGYSFAKQIEKIKLQAQTPIAKPILILEGGENFTLTVEKSKVIYYFKIKNYQEEKISEVDLNYYIEILPKKDFPIQYHLYKEEQEISLAEQKSELIEMPKGQKKDHNYRLEINYDKQTSKIEENILQEIQLKVHSEQQRG